ncbi:MAG: hypothetical protein JKY15_04435 [Deltaproteobacteria bacterium]|nr:hypothetical protein [Deltaproteobacteria bacterium]
MTRIDLEAKQPPEIRRPARQPAKPGLSVDDKFLKGATPSEILKACQDDFDAVLKKGALKDRLEATRRLRELSGGKAHVLKRLEKSPITEQNASALGHIAALAGERDVFNKCASKTSIDSKLALELACEGGHPDIINKVSEKTGKTVLDHGFFEDPPWKKLPKSGYSVLLTQFENKPVEEQVKALRALLELPGGKDFLKEHLAEPTRPSEQVALAAALAGDFELFQASFNSFGDNLASAEFDGENLLHLACQGGNADIIKMVAEIKKQADPNKNPFTAGPWFQNRPIDYLDLRRLSPEERQALVEFYNDSIREKDGGKTLAAEMKPASWTSPVRYIMQGVRMIYSKYKRKVTRGESAPAEEELISLGGSPSKQELYNDFDKLDPTEDARILEPLRESIQKRLDDPYFSKYLKANTFHFLSRLIDEGEFDLAKHMIKEGLFNEVSPRLLTALTISPLGTEQQLELCEALFKKSEVLEERVLLTRHLMSIPGGDKIAQGLLHETFPEPEPESTPLSVDQRNQGLALSALLGDLDKFTELFNRDINPSAKNLSEEEQTGIKNLDFEYVKKLQTANKETLMHFACEGNNANIIKLFADKLGKDPRYFLAETQPPGWFWGTLAGWLFEDKNRPIDLMTLETANELDKLYGHKPNKPGSFSMAVVKAMYIRKPMQITYEISSRLSAIFGGRVGTDTFMSLAGNLDTYGQGSAVIKGGTHFADLGGRQTTAEKPLLSKFKTAARMEQGIITQLYRSYIAEGGNNLDETLSQFGTIPFSEETFLQLVERTRVELRGNQRVKIKPTSENPAQTEFEQLLANCEPALALNKLKQDKTIQISESLIHRLSRVPYIDPDTRENLVYQLIRQSKDDIQKPDDSNTQIEALLEAQITPYNSEANEAIKRAIMRHLENQDTPPSVGKLRSYMIAAARMKDMDLLEKITQQARDPASLWLDTFVRRKMHSPTGLPQLDYGNTLMHIASVTGDVPFIQYVAQNMVAAYMAHSIQNKPGESPKHRVPAVTIAQKVSAAFSGETGRLQRDLPINPFDMRNSAGQTAAELLAPATARVLDEIHHVTPLSEGSLSRISISYLDTQAQILGVELSLLLPGKVGVTIAVSHRLAQALATGGLIGGLVHGGPLGFLIANCLAQYITGASIIAGGGIIGNLTGEGGLRTIENMQDAFQGYQKEASSIQPEMLNQAKDALRSLFRNCGSEDEINQIFDSTPIREPQDLVQLLRNMEEIRGFQDKFVEMISRTSLVRTGRISKAFATAIERTETEEPDMSNQEYLDMLAFSHPKNRQNRLKAVATAHNTKLKLFQEIDTYLSTGLKLSHQQVWSLATHFNERHPTSA